MPPRTMRGVGRCLLSSGNLLFDTLNARQSGGAMRRETQISRVFTQMFPQIIFVRRSSKKRSRTNLTKSVLIFFQLSFGSF